MTTRTLLAVTAAAALLSAPLAITANAASHTATHPTTATHSRSVKPVKATTHHKSTTRAARPATSPDHSADNLNAQSLDRARTGVQQ